MITGAHAIIFSTEAEQARAFLHDVLGLDSVDAGGGWLIFALPPAELAVHPTETETETEPSTSSISCATTSTPPSRS